MEAGKLRLLQQSFQNNLLEFSFIQIGSEGRVYVFTVCSSVGLFFSQQDDAKKTQTEQISTKKNFGGRSLFVSDLQTTPPGGSERRSRQYRSLWCTGAMQVQQRQEVTY